jgi:uncharacterized protein (DUF58 family)
MHRIPFLGRWPFTLRGTSALVVAAACFIVSSVFGLIELQYFAVLLVALVGIALASLFVARRVDAVTRSFDPEVATVANGAHVTVQVAVRTALPTAPGRWRETIPAGIEAAASGAFPALGTGLRGGAHTVTVAYDLRAVRRGIHLLGPLRITATDPFALARRVSAAGTATRIVVAPAVIELAALATVAGDAGGTLHATSARLGEGADNLTPRRYVPGDSMRRIHWRATAHRDTLMVRQEEQESTPEASVVLDRNALRWAPAAARSPGADPAFEAAVTACVSTVVQFVREGFSVEVLDSDGTPLWDRIDGGDLTRADVMVTQFAALTAVPRPADDIGGLARAFGSIGIGPVVFVTGMLDDGAAESLDAVASYSALPVLLAAATTEEMLDGVEARGWRVADIHPGADLKTAWAAIAERGSVGVRP